MDDNVLKIWQLQPYQLQFKNPLWQIGMDKLTHTIAEQLGYKSVSMYKMLVYGKGHRKGGRWITTLVIQLPMKHRHDFGKKDGTAAYLPHYAVHYADAEHALEKVTKRFRLAMRHLERDRDKLMSERLANAIRTMGPDEESFALLLAHEYTEKSVGKLGSGDLKGIDCARVMALQDANAAVPADKELLFYIAQFMETIQLELEREASRSKLLSTDFCRILCELLVDVCDAQLVKTFFSKYFNKMESENAAVPSLVKVLQSFNWSEVGQVCLESLGQLGDKFAALKDIADKRKNFLKDAQVQTFLRGTDMSMTTNGVSTFRNLQDAQNYAAKWMRANQEDDWYVMEAEEEYGTAFVVITKAKGADFDVGTRGSKFVETIKMEHSFQLHRVMQQQFREIRTLQQRYADCRITDPTAMPGILNELSKLRLEHRSQVQTLKSKQARGMIGN
ncbi:hypothetical protein PHYSODRAFT_326946 [Phytophthora sojae]|uniref:Uncharacterized protein n=1 Tax=Phytophthora sojae (strain P6497) TaxID=1094619 RepID=G4YUS5_PHYSP|nr:hypothetical protein PHYSODRAFT_326940 [Phytophthora sojae]XP_009521288.1 hypothetical protein PHYSODRAFT_326946 [Phytophthora sojae]EGZ25994.1 hypothetical protein PHYSODRAFT_326940 [Phytophthora sojae]EGZ26000.1 hypothetical protein PHYSODRAFT_326946 [Phytophthora sojae]|eukprot:XP_009521282.1 hypothetical protein PHYSODRAFT_326940 [Phytophthora sojae]